MLVDVTDQNSIDVAAASVGDAVGRAGIQGLVNNAGIGLTGPTEVVPVDEFRRLYEVNVFGQVAVTQAFLPLLRAGRGRMVNIGSIGDRLSLPFGGPLASSKWAIAAITESLRLELRPWGIHVVLVEPASIRTDAVDKVESEVQHLLEGMTAADREYYERAYRAFIDRFTAMERRGSDPSVVAEVVLRALHTRRPRTRYLVGKDSRRLALMAGWMPDRLFDRIRVRLFGLPTRFGSAVVAPQRAAVATGRRPG